MKKVSLSPTIDETKQVRGFAILCIMFYNFVRHILETDGNEMSWSTDNIANLFSGLQSLSAPWFVFSYWGWYGVPLFLFLSGYGLTLKYQHSDIGSKQFIVGHLKKLFLLMFPAYVLFLVLYMAVYKHGYHFDLFLKQCTFTVNFLSKTIKPGVYLFFGLMAQFYLVFLGVRKLKDSLLPYLLLLFVLFDYCVLYLFDAEAMTFVRHNSIGWMPSFLLGIMFARKGNVEIPKGFVFVLPLLFVVASLTKFLHPVSSLLAIMTVLSLVKFVNSRTLKYVGIISSSLFAIHPVVRLVLYNSIVDLPLLARVALFVAATFVIAHFYNKLQSWLTKAFNRK